MPAGDRRRPQGRPPHPDVLTPAEWRVLDELREGRTNAEIAIRLGISVNTVRSHVSTMLAKLSLSHRHELAAWRGEPIEVAQSLSRALAAPLLWVRDMLATPAAGKSALVIGVAALSITAVLALASNDAREGSGPPPTEPSAASTEEPTATATPPEAPPHPDMPQVTVSDGYDPDRFTDLVAVLYSRDDPTLDAWYGDVEGTALLDPDTGEIVAQIDAGFGDVTARRRHSAGELLLTGSHPDSGAYPQEFLARLFILDATHQFDTKQIIDLPKAASSRGRVFTNVPGTFVLSNDEQYVYYLRYDGDGQGAATDRWSIGIIDLDVPDPSVTVVSLPRTCQAVWIMSAGEADAVVTCRRTHTVLLLSHTSDVLMEESFSAVSAPRGGTAFGFLAPSGDLGVVTSAGSIHVRDADGQQQNGALLDPDQRVHVWTEPFFTSEGTVTIGTYPYVAGGGHRDLEGMVEFDLSSLTVREALAFERSTSLVVPGERAEDVIVLTAEGDVLSPVHGHRIQTDWHSDPYSEFFSGDPDDTDFSFGLVP